MAAAPATPKHPALYYELTGVGAQTVLLLHGLGSSAADWALQAPALAPRWQVLAPDLPGHGRSARPRGPLTVAGMAAAVAGLLEQLGVGPAHVVGLSLGGCVGLSLALDHAARVRSLVVANGFARLRPAGLRGAGRLAARLGLLLAAPMPAVAAYVARGLFPHPHQRPLYAEAVRRLSRNSRASYLAAIGAVGRFNVSHRLGQVRVPTLVLAGDRDQTVPRSAALALHRGIAGARFRLIEDSGHATPYDQARVFNDVVVEFLNVVEAQPPGA